MNETVETVIRYVNVVAYGGVALAALRLHRRLRTERSRWLLATFTTLAGVIVVSLFLPEDPQERTGAVYDVIGDVLIIVLALFPYCLYRFAGGFARPARSVDLLFTAMFVGIVVLTFAIPPLPGEDEPMTTVGQVYLVVFLAYWTILSLWVAGRLWGGGRGQPNVARRRMQLLAVGTLLLNLALLIAGTRSGESGGPMLLTTLLGWASAVVFYFGFAPPSMLRQAWRQGDEQELRRAEASLMSATTGHEVAATILPRISELLGGHGAAVLDREGSVLASSGLSPSVLEAVRGTAQEVIESDRVVLPLRSGMLVVQSSVYAPFFGDEELDLVRSLGTFVDLALSRIALYDAERRTARELERTNEELVALVYGISHDLRSPIVTVIGYLELLHTDAGELLNDEARHYLDRISVSARYMDSLIRDLLELSRIGRTQTEVEDVELGRIVDDVAAELRRTNPEATFVVDALPVVAMNPVRARQLFTNLMENAVRHGGRRDLTVRVHAEPGPDRHAVICVADDGVGIPPKYRERVFGIFERLDQEADTAAIGTGIGLSMCRKIVDQVDGSIWIDDTATGTTFRISLPTAVVSQSTKGVEVQRP